jgi:TusA-related sulfurtransferase
MIGLKTSMASNNLKLDLRDLRCPMLLIRAKQYLLQGQPGDGFDFWVSDRSFVNDIVKLERKYRFETQVESSTDGHYRVRVTLLK